MARFLARMIDLRWHDCRPPATVCRGMSMRNAPPVGPFARGALAGAAALMALYLLQQPAVAQGSTGGHIGKQDKSVSGEQDAGGSTRSSRRERSSSKSRGGRSGSSTSAGCVQAKRTLRAAMALGFDNRDGVITAVRAKCGN